MVLENLFSCVVTIDDVSDKVVYFTKFPLEGVFVYAYIVLWITLSAGIILYNKWILNSFGFPFPVALTMIHMALCSLTRSMAQQVFTSAVQMRGVNFLGWVGESLAYKYVFCFCVLSFSSSH